LRCFPAKRARGAWGGHTDVPSSFSRASRSGALSLSRRNRARCGGHGHARGRPESRRSAAMGEGAGGQFRRLRAAWAASRTGRTACRIAVLWVHDARLQRRWGCVLYAAAAEQARHLGQSRAPRIDSRDTRTPQVRAGQRAARPATTSDRCERAATRKSLPWPPRRLARRPVLHETRPG
jgi:hypothetical protein